MRLPVLALALAVSVGSLACTQQASVKLSVDNVAAGTASLALETAPDASLTTAASASAPSLFGMKLIAVYLSESTASGMGDNTGRTPMIYLNPACEGDVSHCDLAPGTSPDGKPVAAIVRDYFELARPSAEVNAALNAQGQAVEPGTYRYLRVEFCKNDAAPTTNVRWGTAATGPVEFWRATCVITVPLSPALVLAGGESVTVALQYDISHAISVGVLASGESCTGADAARTCFTVPEFVPTVSR